MANVWRQVQYAVHEGRGFSVGIFVSCMVDALLSVPSSDR